MHPMSLKTLNLHIYNDLRKFIFPRVCIVCGDHEVVSGGVCDFCLDTEFEFVDHQVLNEMILPDGIHHLFSLIHFRKHSAIQEVLHMLKYGDRPDLGIQFGRLMGMILKEQFSPETRILICPVPLSWRRKLARGYNQAKSLAEGVCKETNWPIAAEAKIIRSKHTKTQTRESIIERQRNLRNVFAVLGSLDSDVVHLIIDDVFTTGATTFSLAQTLLEAGAGRIAIATLALA